ncbi:Aspartic peptidase domain superfamily [Sesbania bispinosa]|nr:Aspartic peptidase domain superfamily [Sesbania bispinosa]
MPPRTRIPARRETSGEFASQPHDPLQRGRGRSLSRGRRSVNARVLGGVKYDWFDTVIHGRSVGSPPLAWGEFSWLFMARFLSESVRDELAHEFEQLEQTEGMLLITEGMRVKRFVRGLREYIFRSVVGSNCSTFAEVLSLALQLKQRQKEKGGNGWDSHKKQRVEGSQSSHPSVGVAYVPGYQAGHIRKDCPAAVTQPSSSHASTPTALASSQALSALVRQLGCSSGRGSVVAQKSGRGFGGRVQAQEGRDAHVLFDPGATHSFVSLSFATQLDKNPSSLDETLAVTTPVGEILLVDCVYRSYVVSIGGRELLANLIALDMVDFDVILSMDWLASHYDTLDCHNKVVKFKMLGEYVFSFQGEQGWTPYNLISSLGASRLLRKGCQG